MDLPKESGSPYLKTFAEIPVYTDLGSQNQICRDILPRGIVPDMLVGYNILNGPGRTGLGRHPDWHQVFVGAGHPATRWGAHPRAGALRNTHPAQHGARRPGRSGAAHRIRLH
jgi:hypothetical protein